MAVDSTPWFVGGGAEHSPEVARFLAYMATGAAEGVAAVADLKVTALPVPGGAVRVMPGGALIRNRYAGGGQQSYALRNPTATDVTIGSTGSAGGRTDLVVARVLDPQYEGQPPADPLAFDYARLRVIQGVPAGTRTAQELNLGYPAVALARVTLPASTATVQAAHITDLREVANPKYHVEPRTHAQLNGDGQQLLTAQNAYPVGQYFPPLGGNGGESKVHTIRIPEWATEMTIEARWLSVWLKEFSRKGAYWVTFDTVVKNNPAYYTQSFAWASEDTSSRQTWVAADTISVPEEYRGRDVHFALRAKRDGGNDFGEVYTDGASGTTLRVEFFERAK